MLESDLLPTPTSLEAGFPLMYLAALHLDQAGRALPLCSLPPRRAGGVCPAHRRLTTWRDREPAGRHTGDVQTA